MRGQIVRIDLEGTGQPAKSFMLLAIAQADNPCFVAQARIFRRLPHGATQRFEPFQVGVDMFQPRPVELGLFFFAKVSEAQREEVGGLLIMGIQSQALPQPTLRFRLLSRAQGNLPPLAQGGDVLGILAQERVQKSFGFLCPALKIPAARKAKKDLGLCACACHKCSKCSTA
jgi:hypothetical protein